MIHMKIDQFSSHWNTQTLGFSIMGDFSYELPSQPAIDAAAQAGFQTDALSLPTNQEATKTFLKTRISSLSI